MYLKLLISKVCLAVKETGFGVILLSNAVFIVETNWLHFFSLGYMSLEVTFFRTQNMWICYSLRCKQIDIMSMADQLILSFWCEVMLWCLYRLVEVTPQHWNNCNDYLTLPIDYLCLKRNFFIFKINSFYIHDLFIASFDFCFHILQAKHILHSLLSCTNRWFCVLILIEFSPLAQV